MDGPALQVIQQTAGGRDGNLRVLAQSTWRHFVFGLVLGALEERLSAGREEKPPIPTSSNGHGNIEAAVSAA